MRKGIYVLLTVALVAVSSEVLNAEDNIQLSDEYFDFNSVENQNNAPQPAETIKVDADDIGKKGILSITPAPGWTMERDRENELIQESSFNENSPNGNISQAGMAPAENISASGSPSPIMLAKQNTDKKSGGALPKTLKVSRTAQAKNADPEVETILGDWVFDFPK